MLIIIIVRLRTRHFFAPGADSASDLWRLKFFTLFRPKKDQTFTFFPGPFPNRPWEKKIRFIKTPWKNCFNFLTGLEKSFHFINTTRGENMFPFSREKKFPFFDRPWKEHPQAHFCRPTFVTTCRHLWAGTYSCSVSVQSFLQNIGIVTDIQAKYTPITGAQCLKCFLSGRLSWSTWPRPCSSYLGKR